MGSRGLIIGLPTIVPSPHWCRRIRYLTGRAHEHASTWGNHIGKAVENILIVPPCKEVEGSTKYVDILGILYWYPYTSSVSTNSE